MRRVISILCGLLVCAVGLSQQGGKSIDALNSEIRQAEEDIRRNTALLNQTRSSKDASLRDLKLTQQRIASRRKLVSALQEQIDVMNTDLGSSRASVDRLGSQRDRLTAEYARLVRLSYDNYLENNYLAFVFASKDFDDATRRIDYIRRYNAVLAQKATQIDSLRGQIAVRIEELDTKISDVDRAKTSHTNELDALGKDEKQCETTLSTLKVQENKISRQIADRRAQMQRAQNEIARLVAQEARKVVKQPQTTEQLRVATELTGRFDQNRGKLPYPVRGGVIIDHYGIHPHPTQKGLTVNNKGVNIAGGRGVDVRAVFEGTVANIFFYQGISNNVMVRHGSYLTVYSNLASVSVKAGDKVSLNQVLGQLSAGDAEDCVLHFEIWKETANLNPELWLMQ